MTSFIQSKKYLNDWRYWIAVAVLVCGVVGIVAGYLLKQDGDGANLTSSQYRYENLEYGFSLRLPEGYATSVFSEGEGQTVLVRNADGATIGQLHVSTTELEENLRPERVQSDLKDVPLFDMQTFSVATKPPVEGVVFSFEDALSRTSTEIWFTHDNVLYQFTVAVGQEAVVRGIIGSILWRNL